MIRRLSGLQESESDWVLSSFERHMNEYLLGVCPDAREESELSGPVFILVFQSVAIHRVWCGCLDTYYLIND